MSPSERMPAPYVASPTPPPRPVGSSLLLMPAPAPTPRLAFARWRGRQHHTVEEEGVVVLLCKTWGGGEKTLKAVFCGTLVTGRLGLYRPLDILEGGLFQITAS